MVVIVQVLHCVDRPIHETGFVSLTDYNVRRAAELEVADLDAAGDARVQRPHRR